jgi:hypothetical protein
MIQLGWLCKAFVSVRILGLLPAIVSILWGNVLNDSKSLRCKADRLQEPGLFFRLTRMLCQSKRCACNVDELACPNE